MTSPCTLLATRHVLSCRMESCNPICVLGCSVMTRALETSHYLSRVLVWLSRIICSQSIFLGIRMFQYEKSHFHTMTKIICDGIPVFFTPCKLIDEFIILVINDGFLIGVYEDDLSCHVRPVLISQIVVRVTPNLSAICH